MLIALTSMLPLRRLTAIITHCQALIDNVGDPYRPELHYMRGPGPKWRAKHQRDS
ncbi:hypothetical protein JQ604_37055 [Bradyrhizobium jicamae]|uniref:hypothetical protein n=1 Tax=Bradyrhizobium jicamae TaxID=280332 RepID=UPI001BA9EC98|nr:hypothetical protein [Bradyrhizobium jicamae]MBR0757821.1 hypothetical protein [Bradyrhizobium jicamae]